MAKKNFVAKRRYNKMDEDQLVSILKDVALRYGRGGMNSTALAKEHGVKPKQVQQWACNLRGLGVDIPKYRRAGIYLRVVDELRKEHPNRVKVAKHRKGKTA